MQDRSSRLTAIADHLRREFPGTEVTRLARAGEPTTSDFLPHAWDAELFKIESVDRRFDVAFTDEVLEEGSMLERILNSKTIGERLRTLEPRKRLWVLTSGTKVTTREEGPA